MRFSICIYLLTQSVPVIAQSDSYNFSRLSTRNGLSHNQVNAILKDPEGFLWFGTMSGLNRYDGYSFKIYRNNPNDKSSLNDNDVVALYELPGRKMWVQTKGGTCIYNESTEKFDTDYYNYLRSLGLPAQPVSNIVKGNEGRYWFIYDNHDVYTYSVINKTAGHFRLFSKTSSNARIASIKETRDGKLWVVYRDGFLQEYDAKSNEVVFSATSLQKVTRSSNIPNNLLIDDDGDIWIWCWGSGVYFFHPADSSIKLFSENTPTSRLRSNLVGQLVQDDNGLIWVATDGGGVTLINKKNYFKTTYLLNDAEDPKSLSQNVINTIYKDDSGILWLGTYKQGINFINSNGVQFPLYHHQQSNTNSLPFNDVNRFVEDRLGNIWIGTNGGGLIYFNRKENTFKRYLHDPKEETSLSGNVIVSLCIDHEGLLWVGTFYGGLDKFDGRKFTHYKHDPGNNFSLADNSVWDIFEDRENNLWVGTLGGGLDRFDRKAGRFTHLQYKPGASGMLPSNFISRIVQDRERNLWIGIDDSGIAVFDKKKNVWAHYQHTNEKRSLSNNNTNSLLADSKGRIWVGTREGLNLFNPKTKNFQAFTTSDGLPDNIILNILEDRHHTLWISTPNGLCNAIPQENARGITLSVVNYNEMNNLQDQEFNNGAALNTQEGELIFGGPSGFNIINPSLIKKPVYRPKIVFTGLQILNKNVVPGELINNRVLLPLALPQLSGIDLKYKENVFSIAFASLDFAHSTREKYAYMLEGFNPDWLYVSGSQRTVTYTNLDPGQYTFKVKVLTGDGLWSDIKQLQITIEPPFWRTTIAYVIYLSIVAGIFLLIRRITLDRIHMRYEVAHQRREAETAHTLERLKTKFFTNVSHEFRTPLSLIIAPLDKITRQMADEGQKKQLHLVQRNAKRLLNLVNQLLDFRKMEVHELRLHRKPGDIVKFIKEISLSFTDLAEEKHIEFVFDSDTHALTTSFDHDKIERILFNLLSNAFKFTQSGGCVSVLLNLIEVPDSEFPWLEINVIDTGIGIPIEKQDKIFERFFQHDVPESLINQGSGIGLAITKEFVKMHGGEITVESEPDHGSCFKIKLPLPAPGMLVPETPVNEPLNDEEENILSGADVISALKYDYADKNKKPAVLLVEDSEDFRFYLKDNLKDIFCIVEAANGKEGWQKALSQHPDIIVSDISMPEMNGIDLCKKTKTDKRTSHIPVILLTALTGDEAQLKGLEIGANDYITKPFNFSILLSKIKNLLTLQENFKKTYTKQISVQLPEVPIQSDDENLLRKVVEYIEQNMSNYNLSVEELSRQMNMSRVSLYKKLLLLTGKSPVEFIRSMRLKKATQLMENTQMTISQISYEVGFNTPKYFTKSFKDEYDMLPSAYINLVRKHNPVE